MGPGTVRLRGLHSRRPRMTSEGEVEDPRVSTHLTPGLFTSPESYLSRNTVGTETGHGLYDDGVRERPTRSGPPSPCTLGRISSC